MQGSAGQAPYAISWVDRDGRTESLVQEQAIYGNPRLSPDGRRLAFTMLREGNIDVWVYDLERGVPTRITFGEGYDADQIWSPDGKYLTFTSDRDGSMKIYRKRADGSGSVEPVADCGQPCWPSSLHAGRVRPRGDGPGRGRRHPPSFVRAATPRPRPSSPPHSTRAARPSLPTGGGSRTPRSSPASPEIYVQSFPPGDGKWQVSAGTGVEPRWSRDGRELFFRTNEGLMVAAVDTKGDTFRADRARPLFTGSFLGGLGGVAMPGYSFPDYDVGPDGQRFVMFPGNQQQGFDVTSVNVVSGWFTELRRLASAGGE